MASVHPLRTAVGRSPYRICLCRRRDRRGIRARRRSRRDHNEIQDDVRGPRRSDMTELIRLARPGDETELNAMVYELAEFEHSVDQCTLTEERLTAALFSDVPTAWAHIAEVDGKAAACAIWYRTFSTWEGVAGVYLEDLFVRPEFRRLGLA